MNKKLINQTKEALTSVLPITKSKKLALLIGISLVMDTIVTIAEPDLQVLAGQVPAIPNMIIVVTASVGVGIFLVISLLRILFQWKLSYLLVIFFLIVFMIMGIFFDSSKPGSAPSGSNRFTAADCLVFRNLSVHLLKASENVILLADL